MSVTGGCDSLRLHKSQGHGPSVWWHLVASWSEAHRVLVKLCGLLLTVEGADPGRGAPSCWGAGQQAFGPTSTDAERARLVTQGWVDGQADPVPGIPPS